MNKKDIFIGMFIGLVANAIFGKIFTITSIRSIYKVSKSPLDMSSNCSRL